MKTNQLKNIIKEAIHDRIKMIDEAGDIAAVEAKIHKVDEDIQDAMAVKTSISSMDGLKHYVDPEIIGDLMEDMDNSIKELHAKKKELEDQKKEMSKPVKGAKKEPKKEDKKELSEVKRMQQLAGLITENMDETTGAWGGPSRGVETTTLKFNGNKASDLYNAIKNKNHVRVLVPNKGSVTVDIKELEANPEDDSFTGYTADGSDYGMYIKDIKGISYDTEGVTESKKPSVKITKK